MQSCRSVVGIGCIAFLGLAATAVAADGDHDGLDDSLESRLLNLYAPLIRIDVARSEPKAGVGVPTSIRRLVQHSWINLYVEDQIVYLYRPVSVDDALQFVRQYTANNPDEGSKNLSLRHEKNNYMWGESDIPGGATDWPTAISRNDGIYGRVWRPWNAYADIVSVQYFIYITYNDTDVDNEEGTHEGDWVAVDLAVDLRANPFYPTILHMVLHVHGRDLFVLPSAMEFYQGHPVVYLENKVNEPWPNSGLGDSWVSGWNWPNRDGFATNKNFDYEGSQFISESVATCDHTGAGNAWATWMLPIPNIGDGVHSLCGSEGQFILEYGGRYGDRSEGAFYEGDPPKGPPFQDAFWRRFWDQNQFGQSLGPWTADAAPRIPGDDEDPFQYPLSICNPPPNAPPNYSFCLWPSIGHGFAVPERPDVGQGIVFWVVEGGQNNVEGNISLPYGSIAEAVSRVPQGSEIRISPGVSPFRGTISKQMKLACTNGTITIGR